MSIDVEIMWDAMKSAHYKRIIERLQEGIENAYNASEALSKVLTMVVEAVHAEAGTFWFYDRFGDEKIHSFVSYGGADVSDYSLNVGEGISGKVIETGKSELILDCQKDERWAGKVDEKTGFKTKTMICVPLFVDTIAFGCIQLVNKSDNLLFDTVDLEFAEKLAEAASEMLSDQELLKGYVAYVSKLQGDTVTYESIVCAASKREMERVLRKTNCFQILNMEEKQSVYQIMGDIYDEFEKALDRSHANRPEKGFLNSKSKQ